MSHESVATAYDTHPGDHNNVGWSAVDYAENPNPLAYTEYTVDTTEQTNTTPESPVEAIENTATDEALREVPELFTLIDAAAGAAQVDLSKIESQVIPLNKKIDKKYHRLEKAEKKYHEIRDDRKGSKAGWRERYYKSRVMNLNSDKMDLVEKRDSRLNKIDGRNKLWTDELNDLRDTPGYKDYRDKLAKIDEKVSTRKRIFEEFVQLQASEDGRTTEQYAFLQKEINEWGIEGPFDADEYRGQLEQEAQDDLIKWLEVRDQEKKIEKYQNAENNLRDLREKWLIARKNGREDERTKLADNILDAYKSLDERVGDIQEFKEWVVADARNDRMTSLRSAAEELMKLRKEIKTQENEIEELKQRKDAAKNAESDISGLPWTDEDEAQLAAQVTALRSNRESLSAMRIKKLDDANKIYNQRIEIVQTL